MAYNWVISLVELILSLSAIVTWSRKLHPRIPQSDSVFNAIIANKILYALPAYYGYLTQGHREMLQRIFRANRRGFTVREYDLEALAENAQYDLFHNSCSTDHCLNHLYTANRKPAGSMQLKTERSQFRLTYNTPRI